MDKLTFRRYRATVNTDYEGAPRRLTIDGWLGDYRGEFLPILEDDDAGAHADATAWLAAHGWELGDEGWAMFVQYKTLIRDQYSADVIPGPSAVMPDPEEVLANYLARYATQLTRAEIDRTRAIDARRDAARFVASLGLPATRIGSFLGVSRQMASKLIED